MLPDKMAATTPERLVEEMLAWFNVPVELHSDQGRNVASPVFGGLFEDTARPEQWAVVLLECGTGVQPMYACCSHARAGTPNTCGIRGPAPAGDS